MSRGTPNALTRFIFFCALAATIVVAAPAAASPNRPCYGANRAPAEATYHQLRTSLLCLINRARERRGIQSLRFSPELRRSATGHSWDMVRNGYFSHYGSSGSDLTVRVAHAGYLARANAYLVGENIGGGPGRQFGSPAAVFRSWMHSPGHRDNLLSSRFRDVGVGVARGYPNGGGSSAATFTLDLGTRH
ncbi:MAG TPA: CAP domain-containing protein [Solirubrobacterales bacterium]